jgi:hypothetical protein
MRFTAKQELKIFRAVSDARRLLQQASHETACVEIAAQAHGLDPADVAPWVRRAEAARVAARATEAELASC